ncbi:UvrD-helicase domain-containing protein [Chlamydiales bacterium]|nr:UvrD-helicase domain-containing protein [Chlamydiales bacterium]
MNVLDKTVPLDHHLLIEASAGTGKTFSIQHIFIRKLLQGIKIHEILVVTFTRAAVKELKERIREQLRRIVQGERPPYWENEEDIKFIEIALFDFDQSEIYTIHGFCAKMIHRYAWEAGVGLDFSMDQDRPLVEEKMEGVRDFFRSGFHGNRYGLSQVKRLLSVKLNDKDLLETLAQQMKKGNYVNFPTLYEHFLEISFPKGDVKSAIYALIPFFKKGPSIDHWLDHFERLLNAPTIEGFDALLECGLTIPRLFLEEKRKKRVKGEVDKTWLIPLQEELIPLLEYALNPQILLERIGFDLAPLMKERLNRKKMYGPDEILEEMQTYVDVPAFKKVITDKYQLAMVDEFQDTDPIQWHIFKTLFIEKNLILVGDPKQAIYAFRQADIYTYLDASHSIKEKKSLDVNYRSHPDLIYALNELFSFEPFILLPKLSDQLSYHPVKPGRDETGSKFPRVTFFSGEDYFSDIIAQIQKLKGKGCALLVKDRYQAKESLKQLEKYQIPAYILRRESFDGNPLLEDILLLTAAIQHSTDLNRIKALLASPLVGITNQHFEVIDYGKMIFDLDSLKEKGVFHAFESFIGFSWGKETILEHILSLPKGGERLNTYYEILDLVERSEEEVDVALKRLYSGLDRPVSKDPDPKAETGVSILTMHMSKGLEFDHVFAIGLAAPLHKHERVFSSKLKPIKAFLDHTDTENHIQEVESEWMRQIYVTLTRAKESLYIPLVSSKKMTLIDFFLKRSGGIKKHASIIEREIGDPIDTSLNLIEKESFHSIAPKIRSYKKKTCYIESYTSLSRDKNKRLKGVPYSWKNETKNMYTLPANKEVGIFLHTLLEKMPYYRLKSRDEMKLYLEKEIGEHPMKEWIETLTHLFISLFENPLPMGFPLGALPPSKWMREAEFLFQGDQWTTGMVDGFFTYENKYYLLDWKSNWLGPDSSFYTKEALEAYLKESPYPLQATLYTEAMERYLEGKKLSGFIFIFLRGVPDGEGMLLWNQ